MGRQKRDRIPFPTVKVKPQTVDIFRQIASESGYTYANGAALGAFLDRLAEVDRDLIKVLVKKDLMI